MSTPYAVLCVVPQSKLSRSVEHGADKASRATVGFPFHQASLNGGGHCNVTKTRILRTVPVQMYKRELKILTSETQQTLGDTFF
jgi:hypothetical protein